MRVGQPGHQHPLTHVHRARAVRAGFPVVRHAADAVILATGGYGNVFNLSTYARGSNATAIWRAYKRGASLRFEKGVGAKYLELKIDDRQKKLQPEFEIKDWE